MLTGAGNIRRISMHSVRSGERVDTIYWIDGEYIREALDEVAFFMRDWRQNEIKDINPALIDIMAAAHRRMETDQPYQLLSGYRSESTNALLRRSNRGVARNSYHTKGMAADLKLANRGTWDMYRAAVACAGGGVGRYRRSGFVHMDCGPIRTWQG
ncbi:MAG: DUF882 domain-containing protein [Pseudomonadota bacterium]